MGTQLPRDSIPAIGDPRFLTSDEADIEYSPDELVLGLSINADSRAYSTSKLNNHEIVNDVVVGRGVAFTSRPLCFTGIVYGRAIDGTINSFGVCGKLIRNTVVMYDRNTESLRTQLLGSAIEGP